MSKVQNNGLRLAMQRTRRRGILPALAAVALLAALALAALLPQAVPDAQAQEYRLPNARIVRLAVVAPEKILVYPGTNTHIRLAVFDADGNQIAFEDAEPMAFWEGANAAVCAIIIDTDCSGIPGKLGNSNTWRQDNTWRMLWLRIREGAPAGDYRINLATQAWNADGTPRATASLTFTVVGRPTEMSARIRGSSFLPGDRLRGFATVYDSDGNLATFTRHLRHGYGEPRRCHGCVWQAADAATAAALVLPWGRLSNGEFRAEIDATAAPGDYRITISHPRGGYQTLTFTVAGTDTEPDVGPQPTPDPGDVLPPVIPPGPASYTLTGQDTIEAGRSAIYTITGGDAAGGLPNLEGANARVYVLVDGPGKDAVTLTGVSAADGAITLNDQGAGIFTVKVAAGAQPSTVSLELVGAIDAAPVVRQLTIGTAAVPDGLGDVSNLTLTAGTGDAAGSVTLRWTPGENADRHWIAGIKVSDWDVRDFSNLIWTAADANDTHTVTGLEAGAEYAFTVIPGRLVSGVVEWGSWAPIERVTVNAPAAAPQ